MRRYFDVTLPFSAELPAWPGEPKPEITKLSDIAQGGEANVTHIATCVHFGTHMDAPVHFIDGASGIETLDLDALIGTVEVRAVEGDAITPEKIAAADLPDGTTRVFFKTANSAHWNDPGHPFDKDFVAVTADGARDLVARGIKLVGVDYLSVETYHTVDFATHKVLLGAGVAVAEGLDLRAVEPGTYEVACLPMKIQGADGAPSRVVLWRDE